MAESIQGLNGLIARLNAVGDTTRTGGLLQKVALAVVAAEKDMAPVKTGNLRRTIHVGMVGPTLAQTVASANYAAYVEFGTGIYGPSGKPIVPVRAKALRWAVGQGGPGGPELRLSGNRRTRMGQALGAWAFAKSVRGRPATPFMVPGAEKAIAESPLRGVIGTQIVNAWNGAA